MVKVNKTYMLVSLTIFVFLIAVLLFFQSSGITGHTSLRTFSQFPIKASASSDFSDYWLAEYAIGEPHDGYKGECDSWWHRFLRKAWCKEDYYSSANITLEYNYPVRAVFLKVYPAGPIGEYNTPDVEVFNGEEWLKLEVRETSACTYDNGYYLVLSPVVETNKVRLTSPALSWTCINSVELIGALG